MLDYRIYTFLNVCETLNYHQTAKNLIMSQPAVSQHIAYLEEMYQCKLFIYQKRKMLKTKQAEILENYARSMIYQENKLAVSLSNNSNESLKLGVTKTIGHYMIKDKVTIALLNQQIKLAYKVANTQVLLNDLKQGLIDLALIEGNFDKNLFNSFVFSRCKFIGICAMNHPFANKTISFAELFKSDLIIREQGSGSREIFIDLLKKNNYTLANFSNIWENSELDLILSSVANKSYITFGYEVLINSDELTSFSLEDDDYCHDLECVYLKHIDQNDKIRLLKEILK